MYHRANDKLTLIVAKIVDDIKAAAKDIVQKTLLPPSINVLRWVLYPVGLEEWEFFELILSSSKTGA